MHLLKCVSSFMVADRAIVVDLPWSKAVALEEATQPAPRTLGRQRPFVNRAERRAMIHTTTAWLTNET